jgi:hypothetical protein
MSRTPARQRQLASARLRPRMMRGKRATRRAARRRRCLAPSASGCRPASTRVSGRDRPGIGPFLDCPRGICQDYRVSLPPSQPSLTLRVELRLGRRVPDRRRLSRRSGAAAKADASALRFASRGPSAHSFRRVGESVSTRGVRLRVSQIARQISLSGESRATAMNSSVELSCCPAELLQQPAECGDRRYCP